MDYEGTKALKSKQWPEETILYSVSGNMVTDSPFFINIFSSPELIMHPPSIAIIISREAETEPYLSLLVS